MDRGCSWVEHLPSMHTGMGSIQHRKKKKKERKKFSF
jgi:hypothetical protein